MNESHEQSRILLKKAKDDAFMARELMKNPDSPSWGVGFHSQQAVEKAIKAVLSFQGVQFPFTHDLKLLLNVLERNGIKLPPSEEGIFSLIPYGALLRYEALAADEEDDEKLDYKEIDDILKGVTKWAGCMMKTSA